MGVKVFLESGFGANCWPTHSAEVKAAIRQEAARHKLPITVHCTTEADHRAALDMGAQTLAHLGALTSEEILARCREHPAYVTSTLSIRDSGLTRVDPERLEDPLVRLTVPPIEVETAREPEAVKLLYRTSFSWLSWGSSDGAVDLDARADNARNMLAGWQATARKLHEAGIPIVVGTDSGNWPLMPAEFHGPTTLREMQLLGEAGIPAMGVIRAATWLPSRMLGLSEEIGTVEVGKQADLVIVRGNPLEDLRALRHVAWTVQGGIARSPVEWMTL